jgi:metal-responsive CopG/Arc/MetJ family transcriptional regulator
MIHRVEITLSDHLWDRIEDARGDVPRAAWIKRAIRSQLVASEESLSSRDKAVINDDAEKR